jgi:predicted ABC-type exoprotein transport system permease subunit
LWRGALTAPVPNMGRSPFLRDNIFLIYKQGIMKKNLYAKIRESLAAVLPVTLIVLFLSVSLVPMTGEMVFMFLVGAALLIVGIGLFTLGADNSMILMGEKIGAGITRTRRLC